MQWSFVEITFSLRFQFISWPSGFQVQHCLNECFMGWSLSLDIVLSGQPFNQKALLGPCSQSNQHSMGSTIQSLLLLDQPLNPDSTSVMEMHCPCLLVCCWGGLLVSYAAHVTSELHQFLAPNFVYQYPWLSCLTIQRHVLFWTSSWKFGVLCSLLTTLSCADFVSYNVQNLRRIFPFPQILH